MAKKSRKAHDEDNQVPPNSNSSPNPSSIFETLFGEVSVNPAAATIFSDGNPFRRKPLSGSQSAPSQDEVGLAADPSEVKDSESKKRKEKKKKNKTEENAVSEADNEVEEQDSKRERKKLKNFEPGKQDDIDNKKKKKRKRDDIEAEYEAKLYGVQDVAKQDSGGEKVGEKRKKMDNPEDAMVSKEGFDDENKLLRTIFVGNVPLKIKKKTLLKEFMKYGEIDSIRIRSVPISETKAPRKNAILSKKINENADCVHAYIVFKTEESAQASLAHNMAVVEGNHIRVDRACPPRKKMKGDSAPLYDNKRTLFVGNLPFDVKDEEIYQLLCDIKTQDTSVEAVRVIRDPHTLVGKGFGYVLFKTREAANLVMKKRLKLRDRELRLSRAKENVTPSKRKSPNDDTNSSPAKRSSRSYDGRRPEKASLSYQGVRANKKPASGSQKRFQPKTARDQQPKWQGGKQRLAKRPAVAARKARALAAAGGGPEKQGGGGTKRKLENRTPSSSGRNTKARKLG